MEAQKVDVFMLTNGGNFPEEMNLTIRQQLMEADDSKWAVLSSLQYKSPTIAIVLSIICGTLGVDRFYLGHIALGIGKLITCGGLGIWTLIDWFLIMGAARDVNYTKLQSVL
jgi:TM2 domain-containing membrane protein YozV